MCHCSTQVSGNAMKCQSKQSFVRSLLLQYNVVTTKCTVPTAVVTRWNNFSNGTQHEGSPLVLCHYIHFIIYLLCFKKVIRYTVYSKQHLLQKGD